MGTTLCLILLTICSTLIYFLPGKARPYFLLAVSILFFLLVSPPALVYLAGVVLLSWPAACILEQKSPRGNKTSARCLVGAVTAVLVLLLAAIKYSGLWRSQPVAIPLGLSYYTLMVIGYLMEIYRGHVPAEKNPALYALFVCFFPQVTAGPIGRFASLSKQFRSEIPFDGMKIRTGFLMVLLGLFEKMVLADNLVRAVNAICSGTDTGVAVFGAMLLYSLVIYFDFAGYSLIAIGSARVMGIDLMPNFRTPYTATSMQDFWQRWHISLSSWFRDYVYIPLGGNRKGALRRDINTMIIFLLSGAWHGAMAGYVLWGGIHGLYLIAGKRTRELRGRLTEALSASPAARRLHGCFQRIVVYILVSLAWIPFYAGSARNTLDLFIRMLTLSGGLIPQTAAGIPLSVPVRILCIAGVAAGIPLLLFLDHCVQSEGFLRKVAGGRLVLRYAVYLLLFLLILFPGVYGIAYNQSDFIYGQF